jgi:hypothetical protein
MQFLRVDDTEGVSARVRYVLQNLADGWAFEINATKDGVKIVGETPRYTDWTQFHQVMAWAHYQYLSLKTKGRALTDKELGWNHESI